MLILCSIFLAGCTTNSSSSSIDSTSISSVITSTSSESSEKESSIDMSLFPNYIEDYEDLDYEFSDKEKSDPFWLGNVIYNETVLMVEKNGIISGTLKYAPKKILAVRDHTWQNVYDNSTYTIEGKKIIATSTIPHLQEENLVGDNIPLPYRKVESIANVLTDYVLMGGAVYTESPFYYGNQVNVSYVYDVNDIDLESYPTNEVSSFPKAVAKLTNKETLRISALGDSVLEGCSSSSMFNHEPFLPNFMNLTKTILEDKYQTSVVLNNLSVGGKESNWGASPTQINALKNSNPDLVFLHFGINDAGSRVPNSSFRDNMEFIVLSLLEDNPNVEIALLTFFSPNPQVYDTDLLDKYQGRLETMAKNNARVQVMDLYKMSKDLLLDKRYEDFTANGINHPNDYTSRLYLQAILSKLYKY
jgi:lysophospholipase L1-like esterase